MRIKNLIKKLPYPIRYYAKYRYRAIPLRIRYGKVFWETYNFLKESQWWTEKKLEEYQMQQLEKILNHSHENVPYYRRIFDERGLRPKDIQNFNDLKKLPYLTKEIIRENLPDLIAKNYTKSRLQYTTTGGTTGIPLEFYQEKGISSSREWAFILTLWQRVKFKIGDRRVILKGRNIQLASKGKFWEYNPADNTLFLSSYHMNDETLPKYIKKISDFQPDFFFVYPSAITILARFMKENNVEPFPTVKALLCSSENIYPWQRELLEEVFRCRVFSLYGHGEKAVLAGECEKNPYYHIFPEYGFVELIGKDGDSINKDGGIGEIISSGFNNYAMPFIRYKTGDLAVYHEGKCNCGRNYSLLKRIEGRIQNYLVSHEGNLVPFSGYSSILKASEYIKHFQYIQAKKGYVKIKIVKKKGYTNVDSKKILRILNSKYGNGFDFKIEFVDDIPRTKRGKYNYLIQKLSIEF